METRKYVRKNGDRSEVAVWSTPCAICGDPFEVTSPCSVTALINRSDFETVTCPGHRITRSEAAGIGNAKDKKAAFEKVAATKLATPDWP